MQRPVTKLPDQILQAVGHRAQSPQTHLRRRSFDGVDRTEEAVNLLRVGIRFEAQQTLGGNLQMLFRFGDEEVQHFRGNIVVIRQIIREVAFGLWRGIALLRTRIGGRFIGKRGRGDGHPSERECVAVLERGNVIDRFIAVRADLQQIKFENGDGVRQKLGERAVGVRTQLGLAGVLKDVRESSSNIREKRKIPADRRFAQFVRGVVQPGEIVARRLRLDRQCGIFAQVLQALGSVLQELLERIGVVRCHEPLLSAAGFCSAFVAGGLT